MDMEEHDLALLREIARELGYDVPDPVVRRAARERVPGTASVVRRSSQGRQMFRQTVRRNDSVGSRTTTPPGSQRLVRRSRRVKAPGEPIR